jgi:hypothetical protein
MENQQGLERLKGLDYAVVVKKRGNKFILFISELGIVEEDISLEKAYQKVEAEKNSYLRKMLEFDLQDEIIAPVKSSVSTSPSKNIFVSSIGIFMTKLIILAFVGIMGLHFFSERIEAFKRESYTEFLQNKAEMFFDKINELPEQRIENARVKVKKAVHKLRPIINELKALWEEEANVPFYY